MERSAVTEAERLALREAIRRSLQNASNKEDYNQQLREAIRRSLQNARNKQRENRKFAKARQSQPTMPKSCSASPTDRKAYRKLDNPGGGLCSLFALYGALGMKHAGPGHPRHPPSRYHNNLVARVHSSGFTDQYAIALNRLMQNYSLYDSDELAGRPVNATNPMSLIQASETLQKALYREGYKYYMVMSMPNRAITNKAILKKLENATADPTAARNLVRNTKSILFKCNADGCVDVDVEGVEEKYRTDERYREEISKLSKSFQRALRDGQVAIFRGTGSHWYRYKK